MAEISRFLPKHRVESFAANLHGVAKDESAFHSPDGTLSSCIEHLSEIFGRTATAVPVESRLSHRADRTAGRGGSHRECLASNGVLNALSYFLLNSRCEFIFDHGAQGSFFKICGTCLSKLADDEINRLVFDYPAAMREGVGCSTAQLSCQFSFDTFGKQGATAGCDSRASLKGDLFAKA